MYRYLVFAYLDYYPRGGMEDCIYKSNDLDNVKDFVREYIKNNITISKIINHKGIPSLLKIHLKIL